MDKNEVNNFKSIKKYIYPKEEEEEEINKKIKKNKYSKRNWKKYLEDNPNTGKERNIKKKKIKKEKNKNSNLTNRTNEGSNFNNNNDTESILTEKLKIENNNKQIIEISSDKISEAEEQLYQYFNKDLEIIEEIENETLNISDEEVDKVETIIKIDKPEKEINMNICENIKDNGKFSKPNIKTINDSNEILESHIEKKTENSFIFDGKMFKKHTKLSNYIKKGNIKRYIYKCEYNRHD